MFRKVCPVATKQKRARAAVTSAGFTLAWLLANSVSAATPRDPAVIAGSARIDGLGSSNVVITQTTRKAIIDWRSFSVASGDRVEFVQPDFGSIALNRVTGNEASQINGSLTGNGQVWLLNPNGVLVGRGGRVQAAGLVLTTHALSNSDFMDGRLRFSASGATGGVANLGAIMSDGGYAVLAGNQVTNAGLVQAQLGKVVLGAGEGFALDVVGDKLLSFAITDAVPVVAAGPGLATNVGTVSAKGGSVILTARAAGNVISNVINTSGLIDASAVHNEGGTIVLDGGNSGFVAAGGALDVSGKGAGQAGGTIAILGAAVGVMPGALLDAIGLAGGGTINVGGGWQGATINGHASAVFAEVHETAMLNASALASGNGGEITLWTDVADPLSSTGAHGTFLADGGVNGGNGGRIETSGHYLDTTGVRGSAGAALGKSGIWLFDPYNVEIVAAGTVGTSPNIINPDFSMGLTGWTVVGSGGSAQAVTSAVATNGGALASPIAVGGTFLLATGGTVNSGNGVSQSFTASAGQSFELQAIFLGKETSSEIYDDNGVVSLKLPDNTTSTLYFQNISGSKGNAIWQSQFITLNQTGTYTLSATSANIGDSANSSQLGFLVVPSAKSTNGTFVSSSFGKSWEPSGPTSRIDVSQVTSLLDAGTNVQITTGKISEGSEAGNITVSAEISKTAGSSATLRLDAINGIFVNQAINSSSGVLDVELNAGSGGIALNAPVNTNGGTLTLNSTGTTTQTSALTSAKLSLQGVGGTHSLNNADNSFATLTGNTGSVNITNANATAVNALSTAGQFNLTTPGEITIEGSNSFGQSSTLATPGGITLAAGSSTASGGTLALQAGTSFINQAGSVAITTSGSGNWLIYSQDPNLDTFGDLASGSLAVWNQTPNSLSPAAAGPGNKYIFELSPTLTLTAGSAEKTYGDELLDTNLPFLVSGLINAASFGNVFLQDSVSGDPDLTTSGNVATANVGEYAINADLGGLVYSAGYGLKFVNGTLTVNPRELMLSAVTTTKVYDGSTSSPALPSALGLVNGNTVSNLTQSFLSSNAGSQTLSVDSGYIVNDGFGGRNYVASTKDAIGTISPLALTASLTGTVSRTYDATTAARLTAANYDLAGVLGKDVVALNDPVGGTFDTRNAGTGKTVSVTGLALTGAQSGNYTVNTAASAAIGTISPLALTASLTGTVSRTYDATTAATLAASNYVLDGFVNGESATVTKTVGQYANSDTGSGIIVSVELTAGDFSPAVSTELQNYILPLGTVSGPIGTISPQAPVSTISRALVASSAPLTEAAPTETPDASPASTVDSASEADAGQGSAAPEVSGGPSVEGSPASALPPSPIPDSAPPTPPDTADSGDPVLALASAPSEKPTRQGIGLTNASLSVIGGMLSMERSSPTSSGQLPGVDMEFSGSGRAF